MPFDEAEQTPSPPEEKCTDEVLPNCPTCDDMFQLTVTESCEPTERQAKTEEDVGSRNHCGSYKEVSSNGKSVPCKQVGEDQCKSDDACAIHCCPRAEKADGGKETSQSQAQLAATKEDGLGSTSSEATRRQQGHQQQQGGRSSRRVREVFARSRANTALLALPRTT